MSIITSLSIRRSYYLINKKLETSKDIIVEKIKELTELVPDAFNMRSSRVVVAFNEKHEQIWDAIYEAYGGKVARDKIDSFKAGAGTILFYYDKNTIENMQNAFSLYADNFPIWANQTNGALQISIWSMLRELNIGATLQHYNPVIDKKLQELLGLPENFVLVAQMPFGGIEKEVEPKQEEPIVNRVIVA
ncbi:Nitroreductase family [Mycoplasmopsis bovigenitalium]|uniref:Nitroreductase family n=1 Tax=Mycoplasmopsis bovigenitalium TaxID=2112 RepID=A0A449A8X8_9BACT|nr:nitroreductase family protein [Mycoplasmopsis bovigenitalium]VEU60626.1 Nitroreductase family [Mycoplasmopsis bovigenitalium]